MAIDLERTVRFDGRDVDRIITCIVGACEVRIDSRRLTVGVSVQQQVERTGNARDQVE